MATEDRLQCGSASRQKPLLGEKDASIKQNRMEEEKKALTRPEDGAFFFHLFVAEYNFQQRMSRLPQR
jgi:hypothetical protein